MLFGAERLGEILASPEPLILPVLDYRITWDVVILVLLSYPIKCFLLAKLVLFLLSKLD